MTDFRAENILEPEYVTVVNGKIVPDLEAMRDFGHEVTASLVPCDGYLNLDVSNAVLDLVCENGHRWVASDFQAQWADDGRKLATLTPVDHSERLVEGTLLKLHRITRRPTPLDVRAPQDGDGAG